MAFFICGDQNDKRFHPYCNRQDIFILCKDGQNFAKVLGFEPRPAGPSQTFIPVLQRDFQPMSHTEHFTKTNNEEHLLHFMYNWGFVQLKIRLNSLIRLILDP